MGNAYSVYDEAIKKIKDKLLLHLIARVKSLIDNPGDSGSRNELSNLYRKTAVELEELLDADGISTRPGHREMLKRTADDARELRALIEDLPQVMNRGEIDRFVVALQRSNKLLDATCSTIVSDCTAGWLKIFVNETKGYFKDVVLPYIKDDVVPAITNAAVNTGFEVVKKKIGLGQPTSKEE